MARHNKTGRSKGGGAFVQLHHFMMDTAAWRSLTPHSRAVYVEIARLFNGSNNGYLALGVRAAAERANINKDTAARCFRELADHGFIECAQPGAFNQNSRLATEWRLTQLKCDRSGRPPTKAFLTWDPKNPERRPKVGTRKSEMRGQEPTRSSAQVPRLRTISGGLAGA